MLAFLGYGLASEGWMVSGHYLLRISWRRCWTSHSEHRGRGREPFGTGEDPGSLDLIDEPDEYHCTPSSSRPDYSAISPRSKHRCCCLEHRSLSVPPAAGGTPGNTERFPPISPVRELSARTLSIVREITVHYPLAPLGRGQGEGTKNTSVISRTMLTRLSRVLLPAAGWCRPEVGRKLLARKRPREIPSSSPMTF